MLTKALSAIITPSSFQLPLDPRVHLSGLDIENCRVMSSKMRPLLLTFYRSGDPGVDKERYRVLFKCGDDLRQDQLVLQLMRMMDTLWTEENLTLCMSPYNIVSCGQAMGFIELVQDATTVSEIQAISLNIRGRGDDAARELRELLLSITATAREKIGEQHRRFSDWVTHGPEGDTTDGDLAVALCRMLLKDSYAIDAVQRLLDDDESKESFSSESKVSDSLTVSSRSSHAVVVSESNGRQVLDLTVLRDPTIGLGLKLVAMDPPEVRHPSLPVNEIGKHMVVYMLDKHKDGRPGPAEIAGICLGDIVVGINGTMNLHSTAQVSQLARFSDAPKFRVYRDVTTKLPQIDITPSNSTERSSASSDRMQRHQSLDDSKLIRSTGTAKTDVPSRRILHSCTITQQPLYFNPQASQVNLTEEFGGSVTKIKHAVESGELKLSPEGAYLRSTRLQRFFFICSSGPAMGSGLNVKDQNSLTPIATKVPKHHRYKSDSAVTSAKESGTTDSMKSKPRPKSTKVKRIQTSKRPKSERMRKNAKSKKGSILDALKVLKDEDAIEKWIVQQCREAYIQATHQHHSQNLATSTKKIDPRNAPRANSILKHDFPHLVQRRKKTFMRSVAGYCVATYVLGIGDRHPSNIMVTKTGKFLHIDFGHMLGDFKKKYGMKRETAPFVFTPAMNKVIGPQSWTEFTNLCCKAYNILRRNAGLLLTLMKMMSISGLHNLQGVKDIEYMRSKLRLDLNDEDAAADFVKVLQLCLRTKLTQLNDMFHLIRHKL